MLYISGFFYFQHLCVSLAVSPLLADGLMSVVLSCQFTCSREKLQDCVANELNTSVTLCLLHNLTKTAEDGLTLCSSQAMPCHFPEVSPITF